VDHPEGNSFWTVEHFVEELDIIRKKMELGRVHLLGQSWGGMLALQYALDHPEGIKSLIPSNIGASTVEIVKGMHRRRLELPPHIYREMLKHEGAGDFNSPEYEELVFEFYCRFTRRSTPFEPARSLKECKELLGPTMGDIGPAYYYMWGPNEFTCSGTLLDWDVTDRLGEIKVPALILCGQYDECVPEIHQTMADLIPDNEFVMFGNSSHVIILEKEANAYLATIKDFVTRVTKSQ
ncbi:MAG: proline iminopeptidase-family hydrolase, partial [Chloroflexi bacterium]|nr:proline iminopeptidase-family hydrolase [Chloroflexota bacterium]